MSVNTQQISVILQDQKSQAGSFSTNVWFIGLKDSSGAAVSGSLQKDILSKSSAWGLFGRGSQICQYLNTAFDVVNNKALDDNKVILNAIAFNENESGTAATGSIAITGTEATETGVIYITVGNKNLYRAKINITNGQTPTQVGDLIANTLNANLDLPCVLENAAGTVSITAKQKGTYGNNIPILIEGSVAGISTAITAMSNGATNPDITSITTLLAEQKIDYLAIDKDLLDSDASIKTFFSEGKDIITGINRQGIVLTANIGDFASQTQTYNDQTVSILAIKNKEAGNEVNSMPEIGLGQILGIRALIRTLNTNISSFVNTSDGIGGPSKINLPLENTLSVFSLIETNYSRSELSTLRNRGFLTLELDETGIRTQITGNITSYILDNDGNIPLLNRFNDVEKKFISSTKIFNDLSIYLKNKALVGTVIDETSQVDKDGLKSTIHRILNDLITSDNNGVLYALLISDTNLIAEAKRIIDNSVDKLVVGSRTINLTILADLTKLIENVIITLINR